jgi:hypothetical protein
MTRSSRRALVLRGALVGPSDSCGSSPERCGDVEAETRLDAVAALHGRGAPVVEGGSSCMGKDRGGQGSRDVVQSGKRREDDGSMVTSRGVEQGWQGALHGREKIGPNRGA